MIMIKVSQIHAALRWHLWDSYQESETRLLDLGLPLFSTIFAGLAMNGLGFALMFLVIDVNLNASHQIINGRDI